MQTQGRRNRGAGIPGFGGGAFQGRAQALGWAGQGVNRYRGWSMADKRCTQVRSRNFQRDLAHQALGYKLGLRLRHVA